MSSSIGKIGCSGALAPRANDRQVDALKIRVAIITFPEFANESTEIPGIPWIFRIGTPFGVIELAAPFVPDHLPVPIRHVVVVLSPVQSDAEHQSLSAGEGDAESDIHKVPPIHSLLGL